MKVKAKLGIKVPVENRTHQFIEQEAVEVEDSLYYRRLVQDGDLIVVNSKPTSTKRTDKGAE